MMHSENGQDKHQYLLLQFSPLELGREFQGGGMEGIWFPNSVMQASMLWH